MPGDASVIPARLLNLRERLSAAARGVKREPETVHLLAASKMQGAEAIHAAIDAGQRLFGENRVQEAQAKWPELRARTPDLRLHMIGPLQSNKAEAAVKLFDVIETLDRLSLARALAAAMDKLGRRPDLFIEVNIGREPQKAGILPEDTPGFCAHCRDQLGLPVKGLMCIPPQGLDPASFFTGLKHLGDICGLAELSMGMSADFETAITHGATIVRLGTAIFGAR